MWIKGRTEHLSWASNPRPESHRILRYRFLSVPWAGRILSISPRVPNVSDTVVFAFAWVVLFQTPPADATDPVEKLGRERSQFGDIPNSGLWKHGYTGQFGGTNILFRAGSATERYYVTASPGAPRWRISRETMVSGRIRKDWMIFIEAGKETMIKHPGPLWRHGGGGKIVGNIPKMALADLQNQEPLALYHSNVHASYCQFLFSDGKKSDPIGWSAGVERPVPGGGTTEDFRMLPKTPGPYPISPEEREYISQKERSPVRKG